MSPLEASAAAINIAFDKIEARTFYYVCKCGGFLADGEDRSSAREYWKCRDCSRLWPELEDWMKVFDDGKEAERQFSAYQQSIIDAAHVEAEDGVEFEGEIKL